MLRFRKSKSFQSLNICEVPYHLDVYVVYCLDHSDWFVVGSVCLDHSDWFVVGSVWL